MRAACLYGGFAGGEPLSITEGMQVKRFVLSVLAALCALFLAACGREQPVGENVYQVYYVSNSGTKVEMRGCEIKGESYEERLEELLELLAANPDKLEYKAPLSYGFQIQKISLDGSRMQIDMDAAYKKLPPITEVLVRAAIVRTLTQLPEVEHIEFTVEGNQLYDANGVRVGWMNSTQFIDNDGNEINNYELARIKLYFANEDGTKLIAAYREKHYSTNTSKERFIVEELIAGPSGQVKGLYPTINAGTKIVSVMTKDNICYVNLDESFLTVVNNVPTEVAVYSIVNSLIELSGINKVQILINGETPATFSNPYERNLDIVTTLQQ